MNLHVCCNDEMGHFDHRAEVLSIGSMEFEALRDPVPRFVDLGGRVRLAGKHWPCEGSKDYVGNWCWNAYQLATEQRTTRWTLTDFLIWLRGRHLYRMTVGPDVLFRWFNDGQPDLSPAQIHQLLCEEE